jgi:hypothetical protein
MKFHEPFVHCLVISQSVSFWDINHLCLFLNRIYNYEEATLLNSFDNHDFPEKGISKLCLVNELDDSLLLAASCNVLYFCFN